MLSLSDRAKALLLALGIFVLGAVCGAAVERWVVLSQDRPFGGPPPREGFWGRSKDKGHGEHLMGRFSRELELTPEQEKQIKQILDRSRESMQKLRREIHGMFQSQTQDVREKIRAALTPEQQEKYDRITERFERHLKSRPRRPRPPGPEGPP